MRQEAERYARLLEELKQTRWLAKSGLNMGDNQDAFAIEDNSLSNLEATRLTGEEIMYGSDLTMEQVILQRQKSNVQHNNGSFNRTNTQYSIEFHCTVSLQEKSHSLLWDSPLVEFRPTVMQRWTGVYSFSPYSDIQGNVHDTENHML